MKEHEKKQILRDTKYVKCPQCSTESPDGANFCAQCGFSLKMNRHQTGERESDDTVDFSNAVIIGKDSPFVRKQKPYRIKDKACELEHFLLKVVIDDSVSEIGYESFSFCTNLTAVKIAGSVEKIGMYAFEYCEKLSYVEIANGVKEIADGAFQDCKSLTSIVIPASVTDIKGYAFIECPNLLEVKILTERSKIRIAEKAFDPIAKITFVNENDEEKTEDTNIPEETEDAENAGPKLVEIDPVYKKALDNLRISGGDTSKITVTPFKGIPNCAEWLRQLQKILSDCCELTYEENDGVFSVQVTGETDISCPCDADEVYDEFKNCTQEEIQHFYEVIADKDDFGGWLYKVTCEFCDCNFRNIFSGLIASDCHEPVYMTIVSDEYGEDTTRLKG